ncbi:glycosyltransferase family 2 protein [Kineococcus sp. SYSU DK001]|uniref:glycosyltransferase n=1 Tax=Kineococcus sp. SYSU DK001 TaxID=3383122 RepID=UPI003D7EB9A5
MSATREAPPTTGPTPRPTSEPRATDRSWPVVTVVVPVHGDRGQIAGTARALAAQDYPGDVHVVVVDNGDNVDLDGSTAVLENLQLVSEPQPGSYAARNAALPLAVGEVLAFTDGDCLPRPDWLTAGVAELLAAPGPAFVGGAIELFPRDPAHPTAAELWDCANGLRQDVYVRVQGWAATANMMTLRSTFDDVGRFSQTLRSGGDREWGQRAVARGVRPVFGAAAVVDHPARRTMAELHKKVRRVTRGEVDKRRAAGAPPVDVAELLRSLRPNVRSILRTSRQVGPRWSPDRVRYVAVAQWLQYYFIGAGLHAAIVTRRARDE